MKSPSILVVDDEPNNFDVIEAFLSNKSYDLYYAAGGQEAIESLDTFQPDLILLDVMMPDMDGIEVCRHIKALPHWQAVPIIIITALHEKSDLAHCLTTGADDFISKPISSIELAARVHSMLRIKQQYDNIQAHTQVQASTIKILETTLNELQGNLAARLSHELNTPLNGILGTLEVLLNHLEETDVNQIREMLSRVQQSACRLETLTEKLRMYVQLELDASRSDALQADYTLFSKDTVATALQGRARRYNRNQDLILAIEDAQVSLSAHYLFTILHELVENAIKFSPPDTPIKIRSQVVGQMLCFCIQDFGRGMTEAQVTQIGAFMQFDRKHYEQQGIGMGLKIVKKIIDLVGGTFSIRSVYQQGSTVQLTLPLVKCSNSCESG